MTAREDDRRLCPYVGLQPFEEADREFFFGREREQRIIISNLLASPLTILYGSSGVGKSSVLMAGVVPQLRRERPQTPIVVFRNWVDREYQSALTRACIEAVWAKEVDQPKPAESLPFDEMLRACAEAAHETVLVVLDQFEEYFLYHPKSADPASFEAQFARAVNRADVEVGFLIALRDDSLARLDRFQERIPNLLSNRLRLKHLDTAGATVAIRGPLEVWNAQYATDRSPIRIEDELVNELVQQVRIGQVAAERHGGSGGAARAEERYIEAPFLQLVLFRLWDEEMRTGSNVLRRETLDRLKGAKEIVRTHLDDVMSGLEATDQAVCASFFDRLVTPTGSKVACSGEDLARWAGDLAPRVPAVLQLLAPKRILRTVASPDNPAATRYEIFHDVLAPAILDWRRRYVEQEERALAVKEAREQAAKRALRRWFVALAVMTLIAITGWVYAWRDGLRSEANQKAAESIYTSPFDTKTGLDLALKAVETTPFSLSPLSVARFGWPPTPAAEDALRQAIQASRLEGTLPVGTLVSDLAFSPDGGKLATAGGDRTVKIWDIPAPGQPPPTPPFTVTHQSWVRDVAFLPPGNRLVTAAGNTAYVWALDDPATPLQSLVQGSLIYSAFAVSRDGKRLATAGAGDRDRKGRVIKVWDLEAPDPEPKLIKTIDVAGAWVMGLAFSPDGCCLATACVERGGAERTSTSLWNIETGCEILRVPITVASDAVAFTPDGKSLVTASRDARVRVWQSAGEALDSLLARRSSEAVVSPCPAVSSQPADWNQRILAGHIERVRDIDVSPDGSRIASAGADQVVKIWDTETGENLLTLTGHKGWVEAIKFSPDGGHVATASRDGTVKLWNIEVHTGAVTSIAFSPDGKMLATGSSDRTAKLWDLSSDTLRLRHNLTGHKDQIYRLAFDPAGKRLATASFDGSVKLWDVSSGQEIITLKKHLDQLRDVGFSPDSRRLASVGADGMAWLYDLESPDIRATALHWAHNRERPKTQASALAFHPQRRDQWATGGYDGKIQLWDFSGNHLGTINVPLDTPDTKPQDVPLSDIAFSPDGAIIATLVGNRVYWWPVTAFEHPQSKPSATLTIIKDRDCNSIAYSPDSKQLAVACKDAGVRIYDTATLELVKTIKVHKNAVSNVAFSPDGTRLATASLDKTFHVSPLDFSKLYEVAKRLQGAISGEHP